LNDFILELFCIFYSIDNVVFARKKKTYSVLKKVNWFFKTWLHLLINFVQTWIYILKVKIWLLTRTKN